MDKYFLQYDSCMLLKEMGYVGQSFAYYTSFYSGVSFIEDNGELISNNEMNKPSMYGKYCIAVLFSDFSLWVEEMCGVEINFNKNNHEPHKIYNLIKTIKIKNER